MATPALAPAALPVRSAAEMPGEPAGIVSHSAATATGQAAAAATQAAVVSPSPPVQVAAVGEATAENPAAMPATECESTAAAPAVSQAPAKRQLLECIICRKESPPYRCPQCLLRTCCLKCYRQHLLLQQHMIRTRSQDPMLAHLEGEAAADAATAAAARSPNSPVPADAQKANGAPTAFSAAVSTALREAAETAPPANSSFPLQAESATEAKEEAAAALTEPAAASAAAALSSAVASRVPLRVSYCPLSSMGKKEFDRDISLLENAARAIEAAQRQRLQQQEPRRRKGYGTKL